MTPPVFYVFEYEFCFDISLSWTHLLTFHQKLSFFLNTNLDKILSAPSSRQDEMTLIWCSNIPRQDSNYLIPPKPPPVLRPPLYICYKNYYVVGNGPDSSQLTHWSRVVLMFGRRANIKTTLGQCLVFAGSVLLVN